MKKTTIIAFVITLMVSIFFVGCSGPRSLIPWNRPISPAMQNITSVSDATQCRFIRSLYVEVMPSSLNYYVALNTEKFGGDSYKIISTNNQIVMGTNIMMVNFEIYKCK